jgi:hypothetical protein
VNAAVELANRAEGKPTPVVQYEPGESATEGLDPEAMAAMVMRIAKARCEARDGAAEPVGRG